MGVGIILDTWTHADNDTPRGIRSEYENRVIDCSELRVNSIIHLVPLIHLEGIVSDRCREVSRGVSVESISVWQLGLVVLPIHLEEGLYVSPGLLNLVFHSVNESEVLLI